MYSMTASSTACTPLFLNAEPQVTRQISFLSARARRPCLISSIGQLAALEVLVAAASSLPSAAASIILARHSLHSLEHARPGSRGTRTACPGFRRPSRSPSSGSGRRRPRSRPRRRSAAGSAPGCRAGACGSARRSAGSSAPARSILLTNAMRGTPYLFICRQTVSDCGCTPRHRAEHRDRRVEHAQRALDLDGEVDVPGRIDDVDAVLGEAACPSPSRSRWSRRTVIVMPRSCSCSM